jgi:hypothetical protein
MHRMNCAFPWRWFASCLTAWMLPLPFSPLQAQDTYEGRAPDASWRTAALSGIERNRTARLAFSLRDTGGFPVPGAVVEVRLLRHDFQFLPEASGSKAKPPEWLSLDPDDDLAATDRAGLVRYRAFADDQRERGNPVEPVSLRARFRSHLPAPAELIARFDLVSGILAGFDARPLWIAGLEVGVDDRALQRDYTRDVLIAAFSHPAVRGVQAGPQDGTAPGAALWNELVNQQWTTRTNVRTTSTGRAQLRGFKGTYQLTVLLADTRHVTEVELTSDLHIPVQVPSIPPKLTVTPGELFEYSWPITAFGYRLESGSGPDASDWEPVEGFAMSTPRGWRIQLPPPNGSQYLRLRRQGSPDQ